MKYLSFVIYFLSILGPRINDNLLYNYCKILMDFNMEQISLRNWIEEKSSNTDLSTLKRTLSEPYMFVPYHFLILS